MSNASNTAIAAEPGIVVRVLASRNLVIGLIVTFILIAMALVSFVWTPFSPTALNFAEKLQAPSLRHWFGTDNFGRDVLSMIMVGARNSIAVSIVAVVVGAGIGVPLGAVAAARGGWIDGVVMRMSDLAFAFPALLTAVIITAIFGPGAVNAMIAIAIVLQPHYVRLTRAAVMGFFTGAVGKIYGLHFERGGTLDSLDLDSFMEYAKEQVRSGELNPATIFSFSSRVWQSL